jgi:hypothetical protein
MLTHVHQLQGGHARLAAELKKGSPMLKAVSLKHDFLLRGSLGSLSEEEEEEEEEAGEWRFGMIRCGI